MKKKKIAYCKECKQEQETVTLTMRKVDAEGKHPKESFEVCKVCLEKNT